MVENMSGDSMVLVRSFVHKNVDATDIYILESLIYGKIKFVKFDDRKGSNNRFQEVIISKENYCRLTVPPMIWVGFKGLSSFKSILFNIASIPHNPKEVDKKEIDKIEFDWNR